MPEVFWSPGWLRLALTAERFVCLNGLDEFVSVFDDHGILVCEALNSPVLVAARAVAGFLMTVYSRLYFARILELL